MVLAGLVASLKLVGGNLADHRFLFLGAGEVSLYNSGIMCHSLFVRERRGCFYHSGLIVLLGGCRLALA